MEVQPNFNLVFQPPVEKHKRCGCYVINYPQVFPEDLNKNQSVLVPLRSCTYELEIVNALVNVSLTQTYQNPTQKFLQVQYSFPISPGACIYRFVACFGNKRIQGVVKEKQQAKQQYKEALAEGRKAAYGEITAQSKDILNLKIGNIPPKDTVKIEIAYMQELSLAFNTFYQLRLPGTISPRYLNNIPNKIVLAGFREKRSNQVVGSFTWNFIIRLHTSRKVIHSSSHTHTLKQIEKNDACTNLIFTLQKSCLPNRDFVFSYTTENFQLPSCVLGRTDKSSTAMLSFIPKFCNLSISDAYEAAKKGKQLEGDMATACGEYIFLLDRSGSMGGTRIKKAKEALILFIKSLPQDTYFNVISFGSNSSRLFPNSRRYGNNQIDQAISIIRTMEADMGGTQIFSPLENLLKEKPRKGYPKQIFMLTDGGVSNTEGVLRMVKLNNKYARVHGIGIGNGASESLIRGCSERGKGQCVFIDDLEDPADKIIQLLSDSLSAVISSINLTYDKQLIESIIPNPSSLPYYLKGQIVNFYVTFKGQLSQSAKFTFGYEDSQKKLPYLTEVTVDPQSINEPFVDKMGHFRRIRLLQDSHSENSELEDYMYFVKKVNKREEAIKQSINHQILSQFTAFVCTQKEMIDGKYQEINDIGKVKIFIPSPPPIQYKYQTLTSNVRSYDLSMAKPSLQSHKLMLSNCSAPRRQMQSFIQRSEKLEMLVPQSQNLSKASMSFKSNSKKSNPGILDQIGGFFKGIFSSSKQQIKQETFKKANMQKQIKSAQISSKYATFSSDSEVKKQKQFKQILDKKENNTNKSTDLIERLISGQDSTGYWKDISIIRQIFSDQVLKIVEQQPKPLAAASYLIAKWIQKYYPQKQYSLIIKKALTYATKEASNFTEFSSLFDKLIV